MGRSDPHPREDSQWQRTFQHDGGRQTGESGRAGPAPRAPRAPGKQPVLHLGRTEKASSGNTQAQLKARKRSSGHHQEFSRSTQ